jgi:hypothetical protein
MGVFGVVSIVGVFGVGSITGVFGVGSIVGFFGWERWACVTRIDVCRWWNVGCCGGSRYGAVLKVSFDAVKN